MAFRLRGWESFAWDGMPSHATRLNEVRGHLSDGQDPFVRQTAIVCDAAAVQVVEGIMIMI